MGFSAFTKDEQGGMNKSISLWADYWIKAGPRETFKPFMALVLLTGFFIFSPFLLCKKVFLFADIGSDTVNSYYPRMVHDERYIREEGAPLRWSFYYGAGQNIYRGAEYNPIKIVESLLSEKLLGPDYITYRIVLLEYLKMIFIVILLFYIFSTWAFPGWICALAAYSLGFGGASSVGTTWLIDSYGVWKFCFLIASYELFRMGGWKRLLLPIGILTQEPGPYLAISLEVCLLYIFFRERHVAKKGYLKKTFLSGLAILSGIILSIFINFGAWESNYHRILLHPRINTPAEIFKTLSDIERFTLWAPMKFYISSLSQVIGTDFIGNGLNFRGWKNYLESPHLYLGQVQWAMIAITVVQSLRHREWFWILWLLLSLTPFLSPVFLEAFNLFQGDRTRGLFSFLFSFLWMIMAARGWQIFARKPSKWTRVFISSLAGISILAIFIASQFYAETDILIGSLLALMGMGTLSYFARKKNISPPLLLSGLVLVLLMELWLNLHSVYAKRGYVEPEEIFGRKGYFDETIGALSWIKKRDKGFYRLRKNYTSAPSAHYGLNDGLIQNYYSIVGYGSFNDPYWLRFLSHTAALEDSTDINLKWYGYYKDRPLLDGFLGVKYYLDRTFNSEVPAGYQLWRNDGCQIYKNKHFRPLGIVYTHYLLLEEFDLLSNARKDSTLHRAAIVEEDSIARVHQINKLILNDSNPDLNTPDSLKISFFSQNRIRGTVFNKDPAILLFQMPWHQGWNGLLNGKPVIMRPMNGLCGMFLPSAGGEVEIYFTP